MATQNEAVMAMVRAELQKNPKTGSTELYEKARKINRAIGRLSLPQFHARYPLPVMRERAAKRKRRAGGATKAKSTSRRKPRGSKTTRAGKATRQRRSAGGSGEAATAPASPESRTSTRSSSARANVQEVLLQFAGVVATAEKADMVQLMLRMDSWVDRVMEAAG